MEHSPVKYGFFLRGTAMEHNPVKYGFLPVIHRHGRGMPDYSMILTVEYVEEDGQWSGVCTELGTATHADTLADLGKELMEAIDLQLNEMERIADILEYLRDNGVDIQPFPTTMAHQASTSFFMASAPLVPRDLPVS